MPSNTRASSQAMASKSSFKDLIDKIGRTKIDCEIKEILKLFVTILTTVQQERDTSVSTLTNKVTALESENKSLEEKIHSLNNEFSETISHMEGKIQSLEQMHKRSCETHRAEVQSLRSDIDGNEQYERKDTLIISGPDLPVASQTENSKIIVKNLLSEAGVTVNLNDISIAHRIGRKPIDPQVQDKRGLIFKLCRRDLVQTIFNACKRTKPSFFVNCSLTPTRNKIFYVLRQLKKKFPAILKGCRALNGDVVAFVAQARTDPVSSATQETEEGNGTQETEERTRGEGSDQGNRRNRKMVLNSREDLIKFVSDVLQTTTDEFDIKW